MLSDTLPTEKTTAPGAARNCFPLPVIMTTLVSEFWHGYYKIDPVLR